MRILGFIQTILIFGILCSCGRNIEDSEKSGGSKSNPGQTAENKPVQGQNIKVDKEALENAINNNDPNLVKIALELNDSIDYRFMNGETPLTLSIKTAKPEVTNLIIMKTDDLNLKNEIGEFPLHLVAKMDQIFTLNILLNREVNLDQTYNNTGYTPLMSALTYAHERTAKILLINGADPNISINDKVNAKVLADYHRLYSISRLISDIQSHKEVNVKNVYTAINQSNINYLDYLFTNHEEYQKLFKNSNLINNIIDLPDHLRSKVLNTVLKFQEVNLDLPDDEGMTPLLYATLKNQIVTVKKLLANGAKPINEESTEAKSLYASILNINYGIFEIIYNDIERTLEESPEKLKIITEKACLKHDEATSSSQVYQVENSYLKLRAMSRELDCTSFFNQADL